MAVLEAIIENEAAGAEILGESIEFAQQRRCLVGAQQIDARQAFDMRSAGDDVVQEELAIQQHVVAGKELHDARVDAHAVFFPQQVAHRSVLVPVAIGVRSAKPFAALRVTTSLSRLSS